MPAQIQELANHYKLWNDFDEWYVEKSSGLQIANDLSDEWAHIWAGFRYQNSGAVVQNSGEFDADFGSGLLRAVC